MKLSQISLFLENKPGRLSEPCRILANAGINILTLSLADTEQFGILRLIIRDWEKASKVLEEAGFVVNVTEVVALEVEDRPGGLQDILEVIEQGAINVEYMYAFTFKKEDKAIIVFRFEDPDQAIDQLAGHGIKALESIELYKRIDQ